MANNSDTKPCCSFCRKSNEQVRRLLSGPPGVYICNECIMLCAEILDDEFAQEEEYELEGINLLKPKEIKKFLDEYVIGQDDAKRVLRAIYFYSVLPVQERPILHRLWLRYLMYLLR